MAEEKKTEAKEEKAIVKITKYLDAEPVRERFAQMMGEREARSYIASGLLAVRESEALQKCQPESIYTSLLRAGTLRLSVDPSMGQAYIVPFKGRATLIVGYTGLHNLALRTGCYRYINVGKVYEGQEVIEDQITGFHRIEGKRTSDKVIGWIGAFELRMRHGTADYAKTLYMTVEEIHEHAKAYSKSYTDPRSLWQSERERPKMERKTVLRLLLRRWGYLDPADSAVLKQVEGEAEDGAEVDEVNRKLGDLAQTIDATVMEEEDKPTTADLGFPPDEKDANPDPIGDKEWAAYQALCDRAKKVSVPFVMPDRQRTALQDLNAGYKELEAYVKDAEHQAANVEAAA